MPATAVLERPRKCAEHRCFDPVSAQLGLSESRVVLAATLLPSGALVHGDIAVDTYQLRRKAASTTHGPLGTKMVYRQFLVERYARSIARVPARIGDSGRTCPVQRWCAPWVSNPEPAD